MSKYKITYYREYEVETHIKDDALGITDQNFANDIQEMLSEGRSNKIHHLFNFNIQKIK